MNEDDNSNDRKSSSVSVSFYSSFSDLSFSAAAKQLT